MNILVIGAGAIGGVTAAYMAQGGVDVTLVCKRRSTADAIAETGLRISGKRGDQRVRIKTASQIDELSGTFDVCMIATKAYDLEEAAKKALPAIAGDGIFVSMQNGICTDLLANVVGRERTAGAVVTWSCTMHSDTHMEITGEGGFVLGLLSGGTDRRIEALRQAMALMAPTRVSCDILSEQYSKLIINSGITCGGAMTGQTLGAMLLGKRAREFFIEIVREDLAVAEALGLSVPPFGGKLDYYAFMKGDSAWDHLRRHATLLAVGATYRKLKSSSLTALQRGGKTEVDTLNGWICKKGRELHIPTPVNDRVVAVIKQIESGLRPIRPENLLETLHE